MPELPLTPDDSRSAAASIAGYAYQIWFSVLALLEMTDDDAIVLEGAEDIDLLKKGDIQAWQLKHTQSSLTLGGSYARDTIENFFKTLASNPGRLFRYKYITTSKVGTEANEPFGKGIKGIELWQKRGKSAAEIKALRDFLLAQALAEPIKDIIRGLSDAELERTLFQGIEWDAGQLRSEGIRRRVINRLLTITRTQGVIASQVSGIADQLFVFLLNIAASKDRRLLQVFDLMTKVEETTRRSIPLTEYRELEVLRQMMLGSIVPVANPVPVRTTPTPHGSRPPLLGILIPRLVLQDRIQAAFASKDLIYLQGSSGMGKTILANQSSPQNDLLWATFRASVTGRPTGTAAILDGISAQIDADNSLRFVVLDDIDFSAEKFAAYKDSLAAVIYCAKNRGLKILVTGQKPLPSTFNALFGSILFESMTIPRFGNEEIEAVLQAFGCPDDLAKKWAYLVELNSLGHPQLVHARVIELADQGWREPTSTDVLSPSRGVDETKKETAQLLSARDATSTEILARLSLFLGGFRRDQAIKVIEGMSGVTLPGQRFDKLIGPWIEPIDKNYFQVSPLLSGLGNTMWSDQETKTIREDLGIAILACEKLTLIEAENVVAQSIFSNSDHLLQLVLPSLIAMPLEGRRAFADSIIWVTALDHNAIKFKQEASRHLLLDLQLVVALEARHEMVPKFLAAIRALPDTSGNKLMKIWTYGQILFNDQYASIALRLDLLVAMLALQSSQWDDQEAADAANFTALADAPEMEDMSYEFGLLGAILFRCKDPADVKEVFDRLKANPSALDLMKRCLAHDPYLGFSLVYKTWLTEETKAQANWDMVLQLLREIELFGQEHDLPIYVEAGLCSEMIVQTDYLKDEAAAQEVFDRSLIEVADPSAYMINGRAKLRAYQKRWREALEIWDQINPIPTTPSSRLLPIVSLQEAAVAASHVDVEKAIALYLEAEKYAQKTQEDDLVLRAGLLADAATLLWRTDKAEQAVRLLFRVLETLETLPNTHDDLRSFKLRKCVGQLLLNLAHNEDPALNDQVYRTPPGFCSSFEMPPAFKNLPIGRGGYLWVIFLGLSALKRFPKDIKEKVVERLAHEYSPSARTLFLRTELDNAIRESDFSKFGPLMQDYIIALTVAKAHLPNPSEPVAPEEFTPSANNVSGDMVAMTLDAAFAARWLAGVPDWNDTLQSLEETTAGQPINAAIKQRVALFRRVFGVDISELEQIPFSDGDMRIKFDGALLLLARQGTAPEHLLRASIRVLVYLETNPLRSAVGHHMAAAMTKIWLKVCEHQSALLLTPVISIPALRTVCGSDLKGLQKTAAIILEAVPAVGMRLEQNIIDVLRRLAAQQTIV